MVYLGCHDAAAYQTLEIVDTKAGQWLQSGGEELHYVPVTRDIKRRQGRHGRYIKVSFQL